MRLQLTKAQLQLVLKKEDVLSPINKAKEGRIETSFKSN
jgi:hypothetical protein